MTDQFSQDLLSQNGPKTRRCKIHLEGYEYISEGGHPDLEVFVYLITGDCLLQRNNLSCGNNLWGMFVLLDKKPFQTEVHSRRNNFSLERERGGCFPSRERLLKGKKMPKQQLHSREV